MGNNQIQEQRMKSYFIQAAMCIVREEGPAAVKVKRVADQAGYATGTLYNYFGDLNELLFYCVVEFFAECQNTALAKSRDTNDPLERLVRIAEGYSEYFLYNPHIYHLAFLADVRPPEHFAEGVLYQPEIVRIGADILQQCAQEGCVDPSAVETVLALLANTIHGNLMFFLTGRAQTTDKNAVVYKIRSELLWVIERAKID